MKKYFNYLNNNQACVLVLNDKVIYESYENSVKPFVKYVYSHDNIDKNTVLIDKIIGYAIANVVLYTGLKVVYAKIISKPALQLLKNHDVEVHYESLVDNIMRRDRTDICPMERKILTCKTIEEAYQILVEIVINNNPVHLN